MERIAHIRKLLERFYEGRTTLAEEQELSHFFESEQVPEDLFTDRDIFRGLNDAAAAVDVPDELETGIRTMIDAEAAREVRTRRINWFSLSGLAAGLAIILAVYFTVIRSSPEQYADTGTYEDPQEAYEETLKVLSYVSGKFNTAAGELDNLRQVNRTIEAISPLQKINSGNKQLRLLGNLEKAKDL